jgi:hypothetical protein
MQCGRVLLLLAGVVVAVVLVVYLLYPLLWASIREALTEHRALARRQWHHEPPPPAAAAPGGPPDDGGEEEEEATPDVLEYTDEGDGRNTRVRILHPQSATALAQLRAQLRDDPEVLHLMVVTSSTQYEGVTSETPILVVTMRRS